jgi:glutaredoxin-like protein NrdH
MSPPQVFLYALSTCPWCRKTKQLLAEADVPFDYVDVDLLADDEADAAAERAHAVSGARVFPVVVIGEEVVVGYDPDRIAELLKTGRED